MKTIVVFLIFSCSIHCFAQREDSLTKKKFDPTNLFVGGSVSISLGGYNSGFLAGLNPHCGYTFAKWIDAAGVINFQYNSAKDFYNNKYRSTLYGVGAFTRIYPVRFLFIQAQPEYNFIFQKVIPLQGDNLMDHYSVPSVLLGAGYTSSRSGKNSFTYLSILFDVLNKANSPYVDGNGKLIPVIRAGINIGLNRRR